jgi:hypothetical protein
LPTNVKPTQQKQVLQPAPRPVTLAPAPHLRISENVPPDRWRVNYPAIVGAINAFARRA